MTRPVVTTSWDDGHVLDRKLAAMLTRYGLAGTFYIAPSNNELAERDRLPAADIARLAADFEIGGHTLTHRRLPTLGWDEAVHEVVEGAAVLERITGRPVVSFCYPCGAYGSRDVDIVARAGFRVARTVRRYRTGRGGSPLETPTTVHAYRHLVDVPRILLRAGARPARAYRLWRHWDELAITMFDRAVRDGGVFHLWGHSWEIERNGDWGRLARVLEYIAGRADIDYRPNAELYPGTNGAYR